MVKNSFDGLCKEDGFSFHQLNVDLKDTASSGHIRGHRNDCLAVLNGAGSVLLCKVVLGRDKEMQRFRFRNR